MCNLYRLKARPDHLRELLHYMEEHDFPPRPYVSPGSPIAIVRREQSARHLALVRWGFVPSWAKEVTPGKPLRAMAGSGGIVVMDEDTDIVSVCARIMRFYAHESCGQCTPCREGTGWMSKICTRLADGYGQPGDIDLLSSIAYGIAGNTICPLGEAAAWPMMGFVTKFRPDFEARLAQSRGLPPAGYHGAHP